MPTDSKKKKTAPTTARKKSRKKGKMPRAVVVLAILAIALFLTGGMLAYGYDKEQKAIEGMRTHVNVDTFYQGISVDSVHIGGMTLEQAQEALRAHDAETVGQRYVEITVDGKVFRHDIPTTSNALDLVSQAAHIGREGNLELRYNEIQRIGEEGRDVLAEYSSDTSGIDAWIDSIATEYYRPMVNAELDAFDHDARTFSFTQEGAGQELDVEALKQEVEAQLAAKTYPIIATGNLRPIEPTVTKAQLQGNYRLLAVFQTETTSDEKRNKNIQLASAAFDGAMVMPGEQFSLNTATGARTRDKGYQDAGAIKNGKLIPEPGGGVCQVSSTLFNAVVRAGLQIDERNNHSYPISYVKRGHDAMINYPGMDFKFTNNTDAPLFIVVDFVDRKLTMSVYGVPILPEGETIDLREELIKTYDQPATQYIADPTKPEGYTEVDKTGRKGYVYKTWLDHYKDGVLLFTEDKPFTSNYQANAEVIIRGTMPVYTPPPVIVDPGAGTGGATGGTDGGVQTILP